MQWEIKTIGLAVIFVYAFFKFGWAYRLYNYVAILVGATPPAKDKDTPEAKAHAERVGRLCEVAGRHFNRGQRAFFFALGYLGWFISPYVFMVSTAACLVRDVAAPARLRRAGRLGGLRRVTGEKPVPCCAAPRRCRRYADRVTLSGCLSVGAPLGSRSVGAPAAFASRRRACRIGSV